MNRSRTAFALGLVVPLLVLGGCSSGDPEPRFAPTPSTSSPAGPPDQPEALGPVATVRAWVAAQNQAMRTGDTSGVRALSAKPCSACDGLIDPIEKVYAAGGRFDTVGWRVDRAKEGRSDARRAVVNAAVTIAGGETVNASGEKPVRYGVDRSIMVFKLVRDDGPWLVSFIGFMS